MSIDHEAARARSRLGPAFSNSTEWELWSARWCTRCARDAFADYPGNGCPLVLIALTGRIPAEWVESPPEQVFTDSGMNVGELYHCVEFRPRGGGGDPQPRPQPEPDQDGLFERPARATRMLRQPTSRHPLNPNLWRRARVPAVHSGPITPQWNDLASNSKVFDDLRPLLTSVFAGQHSARWPSASNP